MHNEPLFTKGKYQLTTTQFTYCGHTENLKNIADLEVVESGTKQRVIAGLTLSFWGLLLSFIPGFLLTAMFAGFGFADPQAYTCGMFMLVFFIIGYLLQARYTLYITKVGGSKGPIDKNRKCRKDFDELIAQVKSAIFNHC